MYRQYDNNYGYNRQQQNDSRPRDIQHYEPGEFSRGPESNPRHQEEREYVRPQQNF